MINYTTLLYQMKRDITKFVENIGRGLNKVEFKFIFNMIYGIITNQSCHLSKIGRALNEKILLKKTIERLSNNLINFQSSKKLQENYINIIKNEIDDKTIFIIDNSDITKPSSVALESICEVRDGSTGKIGQGYMTLGIAALTEKHKMPIPIYERVYSSEEEGFVSENEETLKGLKFISENFGKIGIRALDRGYDTLLHYGYFIKQKEKFIIRCKRTRDIIHKGKVGNILDVAQQYKGKYSMEFKTKNNKIIQCKITVIEVSLPKYPNTKLNLVIIYGFSKIPMMLLTNIDSDYKRLCATVTKIYLMRWKIEEYYGFKKQQFEYEDFRIRSLKAIRLLTIIVMIIVGYIAMLTEKCESSKFVAEIITASKRIYGIKKKNGRLKFLFYSIADGLHNVLQKATSGIQQLIASHFRRIT